jgi:hypothetical protein
MAKKPFLCILFLFWLLNVYGQSDEIKKNTSQLCAPEFHGRGYVLQGDSLASEFIADCFAKTGLKKTGASYFQPFKFDVNTFPGAMEVKIGGKMLTPGLHYLVHPASGGGKYTLKPKTIGLDTLINNQKLMQLIEVLKSDTNYDCAVIRLSNISKDTLKLLAGVTEKIAEFVPVIEVVSSKLTWSVADYQLKYPLIQLQDSVYKSDEIITVDIKAHLKKNHTARNVIGYLPAKRKSEKYLVFTAHYDHLGRMGNETYFPGANDNASGTAMLIELTKIFKKHPLKVNVLFIAFAGEEAGLIGSNYFVSHPTIDLKNIKFLINTDIMGSGEEGITAVNATLYPKEFNKMQSINEKYKLLTQIKSRGPAANSDHYWFTQQGVPAFFIYTMGPNKNYHDIFDTFENLSFAETESLIFLLQKFAMSVSKQDKRKK